MNRIHLSTTPSKQVPTRSTLNVESGLFTIPSHDYPRVFFGPKHYEPNYAYPLLIWLHSAGADERQLLRIMPAMSMRNYVAVAPRGPGLSGGACGHESYAWPQTPEGIQEAEYRVLDSLQGAGRKFHVARSRVFLAGFDSGGTMAFRVAMNHPERFSGVLSICGAFPKGYAPFARLGQARQLQLFLALGRDSREYPPAEACEDLRLFHAAGISVTLRQYPCGQQLTEPMLGDMNRWMMEQIAAR